MTMELPEEIVCRIREVSLDIIKEVESRYINLLTKTYTDGWAEGYLTRIKESSETDGLVGK